MFFCPTELRAQRRQALVDLRVGGSRPEAPHERVQAGPGTHAYQGTVPDSSLGLNRK